MRGLALALIVSVFLSAGAAAQEVRVPARLTLEDALRLAEAHSPALAASRAATDVPATAVTGATQRPNPTLTIDSQGFPFSQDDRPPFFDDQELTIAVEQEFEPGGRRDLRTRVARLGVDVSAASARDRVRLVRFDVRRAYMQAVLAKADWDAARVALDDLDTVLAINRARYEQGELSGVELRRLQVERFRFADEVRTSELGLTNARTTLLAAINVRPLDQVFETAETLAAPADAPAVNSSLRDRALATRPDLVALRSQEARADADLALQRALRTPAITIGGGWQRDFGTNAVVLNARIPLPFFARNEGGVARAVADRRLAAATSSAAAASAALEIQLAANGVAAHRARVEQLEREYLRNAREARDIVLAAYRAGASTLIDYLDAQRALRDAQRVQNRAVFDYRMSLFQLESALGLPAPTSGSRP
ncbi:MAG: TolC family protein [Acidobacteria bacterium]|nr:TolC family protein [Acidobacteriota bacterium]